MNYLFLKLLRKVFWAFEVHLEPGAGAFFGGFGSNWVKNWRLWRPGSATLFLEKPLVSTFLDISEIWDPLTARILDSEQLCILCWKTIWGLLHGQNCQKGRFYKFFLLRSYNDQIRWENWKNFTLTNCSGLDTGHGSGLKLFLGCSFHTCGRIF